MRGLKRLRHHWADRDDRHVPAGTDDGRPADRGAEVLGRDLRVVLVKPPVLDVDDRLLVLDGGDQEPLGVPRIRRNDRLEPGDMGEDRVMALGVLRAVPPPAAHDRPHDQRHRLLPPEHGRPFRGVVDELVHRQHDEVDPVVNEDGAHAEGRRAHADPGEGVLGERALDHAVGPELLEGPGQGAPDRARVDDPDPDQEDGGVVVHRLDRRVTHRLSELHRAAPSASSAAGNGDERAYSNAASICASISAVMRLTSASDASRLPFCSGPLACHRRTSASVR